jgi:hypothetical protein
VKARRHGEGEAARGRGGRRNYTRAKKCSRYVDLNWTFCGAYMSMLWRIQQYVPQNVNFRFRGHGPKPILCGAYF